MEKSCTFFGHRECPLSLRPVLYELLKELICRYCVTQFYLGHQGAFDVLALDILQQLKTEYPHIRYTVVLTGLNETFVKQPPWENTLFPAELQCVPPQFAIDRRNRWMLKQADFVVTYIVYSWGGAAKFADLAKRQGKTVINLQR